MKLMMSAYQNLENSDSKKIERRPRQCNICGDHLPPKYQEQYKLFCRRCKERSEILRFSDWLPETKIVA